MTKRLHYGTTAKVFHWLIVALLLVQYPIGWLMPDIHRGMRPGAAMTLHVSFGMVILVLIVLRLAWRLVDVLLLSRATADAGFGQCGGGEDDGWPASGDGMGVAGGDRHPCGVGDGPPLHLPRPHHAADAAWIEWILEEKS